MLLLAVRAGGRCEFPGCNRPLFAHHLTLTIGNFGQFAHIQAFSPAGPRGGRRPKDVHSIDNLLLLCHDCHKLIDDHPTDYPTSALKDVKAAHEKRIAHLTGLKPDKATVILQFKARINGDAVDIPLADVASAVDPRYPTDRHGHVIDVTQFGDEADATFQAARAKIRREIDLLYAPGMEAERVHHISVFALAPIPLLVYFGARLTNKIPLELYQRHRDTKDWVWKTRGTPVNYTIRIARLGSDPSKVAVVLPLSGPIPPERLPAVLDASFTIYELTLDGRDPSTDFLRMREDLVRFETAYRGLLARIVRTHPDAPEIHLFPAVPAPVAVACGHQLLQKAQPPLLVYDYVAERGGFIPRLRTNDHDHT